MTGDPTEPPDDADRHRCEHLDCPHEGDPYWEPASVIDDDAETFTLPSPDAWYCQDHAPDGLCSAGDLLSMDADGYDADDPSTHDQECSCEACWEANIDAWARGATRP